MSESPTLYDQVVEVGKDFLGPASERFMRRQITTHLGIEPQELHRRDLDELVNWIRLTVALLTDDSDQVDAFARRLLALAKSRTKQATVHGKVD